MSVSAQPFLDEHSEIIDDAIRKLAFIRKTRERDKADRILCGLLHGLGLDDVAEAFEAARRRPLRSGGRRMTTGGN